MENQLNKESIEYYGQPVEQREHLILRGTSWTKEDT